MTDVTGDVQPEMEVVKTCCSRAMQIEAGKNNKESRKRYKERYRKNGRWSTKS